MRNPLQFDLAITIKRNQSDVFLFLRDKDKYKQKKGSPVLVLEKITEGAVEVGTKYREVVQMLPFYKGEIISVITRYDQPQHLEEDFSGAGMKGHLAYHLIKEANSTKLIQQESIEFIFPLNLLNPGIRKVLHRKLVERLEEIKLDLERQN